MVAWFLVYPITIHQHPHSSKFQPKVFQTLDFKMGGRSTSCTKQVDSHFWQQHACQQGAMHISIASSFLEVENENERKFHFIIIFQSKACFTTTV
jgi:hypothetical protein